jgi:hypothetical protein
VDKESAVAKRIKVPKRIAGVKIPKAVRKGPIGHFLNSSAGQRLIAEALLVAGGVTAARGADADSPFGGAIRHSLHRITEGEDGKLRNALRLEPERFAHALSDGFVAFRDALTRDTTGPTEPEVDAETTDSQESDTTSDGKKKSARYRRNESPNPH